jgi:hypothetical protein
MLAYYSLEGGRGERGGRDGGFSKGKYVVTVHFSAVTWAMKIFPVPINFPDTHGLLYNKSSV